MKISQILLEEHLNKNKILLESVTKTLTPKQQKIVEGIYNNFMPLIEASLTPQQIQGIFQNVEQHPDNKNALGKTVNAAKYVDELVNKAGRWIQSTTPIKNFDAQFDKLKNTINTKFPDSKLLDGISKMGMWAKENPGKTAAVIGILTTIAALAAGPVGGLIAGQMLRGTAELLKGEKLSTAIGKGLKTAAYGWLAGMALDTIKEYILDVEAALNPKPIDASMRYYEENIGNGLPSVFKDATIYGTREEVDEFNAMFRKAVDEWQRGDYESAADSFEAAEIIGSTSTEKTYDAIAMGNDPFKYTKMIHDVVGGFKAAAQGLAAGGTGSADTKQEKPTAPRQQKAADNLGGFVGSESIVYTANALTESQIIKLFEQVELVEGPLDRLKQLAGSIAQGANKLAAKATNKVTAQELQQAWEKAGSLTDSAAVAKVLQDVGIKPETISSVYKSSGIEDTPADTVPTTEPTSGQSAFGSIASQLSGEKQPDTPDQKSPVQTKSSTGGATTQTPAGQTHTANPENPNQDSDQQSQQPAQRAGLRGFMDMVKQQYQQGKEAGSSWAKGDKLDQQPTRPVQPNQQPAEPAQPEEKPASVATATPLAFTPGEPITIGGQKIMPTDKAYAKLAKQLQSKLASESVDLDKYVNEGNSIMNNELDLNALRKLIGLPAVVAEEVVTEEACTDCKCDPCECDTVKEAKKPDADGDGIPDWADEDDEDDKEKVDECGEMPMSVYDTEMSPMSAVGDTDAMAAMIAPGIAAPGMGAEEPEAMMPQEEPAKKASYTLSIRNGDSTLNVTTDNPNEITHIMKLAGIKSSVEVKKDQPKGEEEQVDEWANTPDATRAKEPRAYGDIRDWGRKGTGASKPAYKGTKASGDNPLSEQAIINDYKTFKGN